MSTTSKLTTAEQIEDYISQHPAEELIVRRSLLKFGPARVVDTIVFKYVHKTGSLIRVAWGCYRKRERVSEVTVEEVVRVKAAAFGRTIVESPRNVAFDLGVSDRPCKQLEYLTSGRSSSFFFGNRKIILTGASPRKMALGDGKVGKAIRALWHMGRAIVDEHVIGKATKLFSSRDRIEMGKLCASMPEWLGQYFYAWRLLERESPSKYPDDFGRIWGVREQAHVYRIDALGGRQHRLALTS